MDDAGVTGVVQMIAPRTWTQSVVSPRTWVRYEADDGHADGCASIEWRRDGTRVPLTAGWWRFSADPWQQPAHTVTCQPLDSP
ncbi:hypothetical protein EV192_106622 [Actinocrispum wychmicini]|uniref:Uncharacterized protein n=1 Tax=Actinocrispum wychmicini TaxID=1213861 RepID=A0A4R2JSJ8_9PSEU|nr:hypothetical protein EV192_106622 [Actinocrispum wychmicini]